MHVIAYEDQQSMRAWRKSSKLERAASQRRSAAVRQRRNAAAPWGGMGGVAALISCSCVTSVLVCLALSQERVGRFSSNKLQESGGVHICTLIVLGDHIPHTSPYLTVQKDFFTIDYEGVIVISIPVSRRELARAPCPITFQS